jgi:hypothetical protein
VRLRAAQRHATAGLPDAAGDHREVDHERRVRERELAQVDEDLALRGQSA